MQQKFLTTFYYELKKKRHAETATPEQTRENFTLTVTYEWKGSGNKIEEKVS
jgi:hypothetical protein